MTSILLSLALAVSAWINIVLVTTLIKIIGGDIDEDAYDEEESPESVKVAFHDGTAYWINNGEFMTAPTDENGSVIVEEGKNVDTMGMDDEELKLIAEIVDALRED